MMDFNSFLSKKNQQSNNEGEISAESQDKKIEFAGKVSAENGVSDDATGKSRFNLSKQENPFKEKNEKTTENLTNTDNEDAEIERMVSTEKTPENFIDKIKNIFSKIVNKIKSPEGASSKVLEMDLVKGEVTRFFDWQRAVVILLSSVFATLMFISVLYWAISFWGNKQQYFEENSNIKTYYQLNREIKDFDDELQEALKLKGRIDLVDFLLKKHIYWSNYYKFLEDNTLSNVVLSGGGGSITDSYSFNAKTDDYRIIDAQVKYLNKHPYVNGSAEVTSASLGVEQVERDEDADEDAEVEFKNSVSFSISFNLDSQVFNK